MHCVGCDTSNKKTYVEEAVNTPVPLGAGAPVPLGTGTPVPVGDATPDVAAEEVG